MPCTLAPAHKHLHGVVENSCYRYGDKWSQTFLLECRSECETIE
jgi:hypothetical protein